MSFSRIWAWGLGVFALACSSAPGRIESGHYTSNRYPLEVVGGGDAASAGLMPKGWKLENFYGAPLPDKAKETDDYKVVWEFDKDGDGDVDLSYRRFLYELRFQSLLDDATVWLRVVPVSTDRGDVQLPVLVESYVQGLSGGKYEAVGLGTHSFTHSTTISSGVDKRFAATLVDTRPCQLAATECQLATIEVANVDQLKVAPDARARKIQLLVARAKLVFEADTYSAPTFVVIGYSNQPARFDAGLADFHDFLGRVAIRGERGFKLVNAPVSAPAPSNDSAPSAPTTPNTPTAATSPVSGGEAPVGAAAVP